MGPLAEPKHLPTLQNVTCRSFADVTPRGYQVVTPAGTAGVELLRNAAPGSAMREVIQIFPAKLASKMFLNI